MNRQITQLAWLASVLYQANRQPLFSLHRPIAPAPASSVKSARHTTPALGALVSLFYDTPAELGEFTQVQPQEMPASAQQLLAHDEHMTVTVEAFHNSPVDVEVVEAKTTGSHYSRKILLRRQSDGGVVQYGIVRLTTTDIPAPAWKEIESQQTPLGRVLINHDVLREVMLITLWKIEPAEELTRLLELPAPATCYGRTAFIYCNGLPAVELLEIVTLPNW